MMVAQGKRKPGKGKPGKNTPILSPESQAYYEGIGEAIAGGGSTTTVYQPPDVNITYASPSNDSGADFTQMLENMTNAQNVANQAAIDAAAQNARNQTEIIKGILQSYNLMSLYDTMIGYIQDGYDSSAIQTLIRTTPEYKRRFPAMEALGAKGRAISEAEYISYEQTASGLERRYGLPEGMLMGNLQTLLENEVSASELNDRVMLASAAAIEAPQDVKDTFQQYYGIGSGGMTAYFLDADIATPLLEKQYAAAQIGAEAARQGIGMDVYGAQNLQGLGITQQQARQGFGEVAASQALSEGRGDVVTQQEMVQAKLGGNASAQEKVQRATMGKLGAFQGGGEALQTQKGAVGLGSAATR